MRRRLAAFAALIAATVATGGVIAAAAGVLAPSQPQAVTTRLNPAVSRAEWLTVSRELTAALPAQQRADGSFRDAFSADGSSRYGDAMLGYALIQAGTRDGNRGQALSGILAIDAATRRNDPWFATRGFELWAVAGSYNVVRQSLRHLPQARAAMTRWAVWLRRQRTTFLGQRQISNKVLVDAVAVLETQRTGLTSTVPGTILGSARADARQRVADLISRRVPDALGSGQYPVLSDPPSFPIAYHALSYSTYARAVRLLGTGAGARAGGALQALGRTTWAATAPDGELGYWGRSTSQVWTMPAAAYGLADTMRRSTGVWRARYQATAHRLLRRLQAYGVGPRAEWTTPSLRGDFDLAVKSLDGYARATEYTGLALVHLNLAIPLLPATASLGEVAGDRDMRAVVGQGQGRFAVVRRGDVWFAARERGGLNLRYDLGPVAVKRFGGSSWRDVMPLRPPGNGTAGPVLLQGGERGIPDGQRLTVGADGVVTIAGAFRTRAGKVLRSGVSLRVVPTPCGVRWATDGRAGDRFEFSAFLRGERDGGNVSPAAAGDAFADDLAWEGRLELTTVSAGLASASDAPLSRAQLILRADRDGPVSLTQC